MVGVVGEGYVEAVGDHLEGDPFDFGEGFDFREPEGLVRLDEADDILHLCSGTLWVYDEHM